MLADQFGNNRTSSNLDASILLLGRVVVSAAGPYPETAGSSMRVSAFQSVVLADGVDSGFYIGRYIMQRTALRAGHLAYLRTSIGDDHNFLFFVLLVGVLPSLLAIRSRGGPVGDILWKLEQPGGPSIWSGKPCSCSGNRYRHIRWRKFAPCYFRNFRCSVRLPWLGISYA